MASSEEYQQRQFWENNNKALSDWESYWKAHDTGGNAGRFSYNLVLSECAYDEAKEKFGDNCGFTKDVNIIRGYPKFDEEGKK